MLVAFGDAYVVESGIFAATETGGMAMFEQLNANRRHDFHLDY